MHRSIKIMCKPHRIRNNMKFAARIFSAAAAVVVAFSAMTLCFTANAARQSSVSLRSGTADISLSVPSGFTTVTADDLDKPSEYFKNLPINKNEAISRIESGILLDAFSNDKTREIRFSVFESNRLGKYAVSSVAGSQSSTKSNLIKGINNFSALGESERQKVISAISDELKDEGHTFLATPSEIVLSGYKFIRSYARIGSSTSGYTYTSVMTIFGGKCYELTCFNNMPMLEQEQIDENNVIISSLKLKIKGNDGEIAANKFSSAVTFVVIFLAIAVIFGVVVSFVKPLLKRGEGSEKISSGSRR